MSDHHQTPSSGWREWSKYVLTALEKTDEKLGSFDVRLRKLETEQAVIKTKLALYVVVATSITVLAIEAALHFLD